MKSIFLTKCLGIFLAAAVAVTSIPVTTNAQAISENEIVDRVGESEDSKYFYFIANDTVSRFNVTGKQEIVESGGGLYRVKIPKGYQVSGLYKDENYQEAYIEGRYYLEEGIDFTFPYGGTTGNCFADSNPYIDIRFMNYPDDSIRYIYIKCIPTIYSIRYELAGGKNAEDNPTGYSYGSTTVLQDATKEGYEFKGWYGQVNNVLNSEKTTSLSGLWGYLYLTAQWVPGTYNITYELYGGTNNENNPASYTTDEEAVILEDAVKEGCEFDGWYLDSQFTQPVTTLLISEDTTVYAKWKAKTYSVTYDLAGGENAEDNPSVYTYGTTVILEDAVKEGYKFEGWYTEPTYNNQVTKLVNNTNDINLYAKWEIKKYNISYQLNGGTNNESNPEIYTPINDGEVILNDPVREGYEFRGWYTDADFSQPVESFTISSILEDTTVYAKWEIEKYNISYQLNGGKNAEDNPSVYTYGTTIILNDPVRYGYIFKGWYTDADFENQITQLDSSVKDVTVYAKWECAHVDTIIKNEKEETCSETGYTGDIYCCECNSLLFEGSVISANGIHEWDEGVVTKEPTMNERGIKVFTCKECQTTRNEEIFSLSESCLHEDVKVMNTVSGNCGVAGYTGDTYCSFCLKELEKGSVIPANGKHKWDEGLVVKQSTTTTTGIKVFTCKECGEKDYKTIPIICSHENCDFKNSVESTCGVAGYTGDIYCLNCNEFLEKGSVIPANGKHEWDEGTVTVSPTTTTTGIRTCTCDVCGKTKEIELPKLDNNTQNNTENNTQNNTQNATQNQNNNQENNTQTQVQQNTDNNEEKKALKNYKAKIKKVSNPAKKKIKVQVAKNNKEYKYQIQISTSKKFKKLVKSTKTSKSSITIKNSNFKKGKTLYVRVRAYQKINGSTICGKWSAVKKIKIKK